jgi:predicted flavoprotein YhiN
MMAEAVGSFEVKLVPEGEAGSVPGRMTIDKQFHGDLQAISKGMMLMMGTAVKGSAGYVAMEQVTGTLAGLRGSFILQHSGTMTRGVPTLSVTVVPDSGTDELVGLTGQMAIDITDGKHLYRFHYEIG